MKAYVFISGEPEVGIPHVKIPIDLGIEEFNDYEERMIAKRLLELLFIYLHGFPVGIEFDDEQDEWMCEQDDESLW